MFSVLWTWLRTRTRDAVLAGVGDAVMALDGADDGTSDALAALTARLQSLPRPSPEPDDTAGTRKRK